MLIENRKSFAWFFIIMLLVFQTISLVAPSNVFADELTDRLEECLGEEGYDLAYVLRTPTQSDIDILRDYNSENPLIERLTRKMNNGGNWIYIYGAPAAGQGDGTINSANQFMLVSDDWLVNDEWQFQGVAPPENINIGFRVPKDRLDETSEGETVCDSDIAQDFVDANDDNDDGVPDDIESPEAPDSATADEIEEVEGKYEKCMESLDNIDEDGVKGGFFICFIIRFVDDRTEQWIDKVDELLSVGGDEYNTDEMRKAWSYFRNIASLLLMVIGIVMVIGQGISKE